MKCLPHCGLTAQPRLALACAFSGLLCFSLTVRLPGRAWAADPVDEAIASAGPQIDSYLQPLMHSQRIPGLSIAVVHQGKLVLSRAYGLANVELSVPASPSSVYQIASNTKQFTATAVMMLFEEGKVDLDEKIATYLSGLPNTWSKITVRQLLTHTSGIPDYTGQPGFYSTLQSAITQPGLLPLVSGLPLDFQPGEKWEYSNTNYFLLGMLIEKVSHQQYGQFLAQRIFQPLQMTATRVNDFGKILPNRASGYTLNAGVLANADLWHPTRSFAAGAVVSTVEDMAKWDAALYGETLLKRASLELMWTPAKLNNGQPAVVRGINPDFEEFVGDNYGFGWVIHNYQKTDSRVWHGGSITGFNTVIARYLDDHVTVVLFLNIDTADPVSLANGVHRIVSQALAAPSP